MTLATRCPACNTVFRVVQDQLKVADGWARCGRCERVFDAREALLEGGEQSAVTVAGGAAHPVSPAGVLDTTGPTASQGTGGTPAGTTGTPPVNGSVDIDAASDAVGLTVPQPDDGALANAPAPAWPAPAEPGRASRDDPALPPSAAAVDVDAGTAIAATARDPETHPVDPGPSQALSTVPAALPSPLTAIEAPPSGTPPPADVPAFVRQADHAARWRSPQMRRLLAATAVALSALLAAQAAWRFRDELAARWPAARPALDALCAAAGCRIEAPRRLDDLAVDSSSLTRAPSGTAVQLALVLRNRGAWAVAMPWVDLTLTDAAGQPLARRALAPTDLRVASPALAPGAQATLQAVLAVDGPAPSGYVLEIFYP